jgi:hypothetical protein
VILPSASARIQAGYKRNEVVFLRDGSEEHNLTG